LYKEKTFCSQLQFFFIGENRHFIGKTIIFAEKPFCADNGGVLLQCKNSFLTIKTFSK